MSISNKIKQELKSVGLATLFFFSWFYLLTLLKSLVLAEYHISFNGLSIAFIGALIVAKVILVLEKFSFGPWERSLPGWGYILFRTSLYTIGIIMVLILEEAFKLRNVQGNILPNLIEEFRNRNVYQIIAKTIGVTGALLVFNIFYVLRIHLGNSSFRRIFTTPLPILKPESKT